MKTIHKPQYPIYVISKGRWGNCLTARALERMGAPYKLVVEPTEYDNYAENYDESKIFTLPFHDLGKGSIPARNWVWEHSINNGDKRHWIVDDNIEDFNRLIRNTKHVVRTPAIFRACEDFTDRYTNVGLSGMNYYSFCKSTERAPAFTINTRIYSCILVRNNLPFRWRGRYNEDTDLSLRVLKSGECTILFNAFLCGKVTTMRMKGGNTDNVYDDTDNRKEFAEALVDLHPDVAKVVWRFNRWHHHVDYSSFKKNNILKLKSNLDIPDRINEYGMVLKEFKK